MPDKGYLVMSIGQYFSSFQSILVGNAQNGVFGAKLEAFVVLWNPLDYFQHLLNYFTFIKKINICL